MVLILPSTVASFGLPSQNSTPDRRPTAEVASACTVSLRLPSERAELAQLALLSSRSLLWAWLLPAQSLAREALPGECRLKSTLFFGPVRWLRREHGLPHALPPHSVPRADRAGVSDPHSEGGGSLLAPAGCLPLRMVTGESEGALRADFGGVYSICWFVVLGLCAAAAAERRGSGIVLLARVSGFWRWSFEEKDGG